MSNGMSKGLSSGVAKGLPNGESNRLTANEALIALHETEGVGWHTIERIVAAGKVHEALYKRAPDWVDMGLNPKTAKAVADAMRPEAIQARRLRRDNGGFKVLTRFDRSYPRMLRRSDTPPWVLYYIGDLALFDRPALAMVGTRLATAYGRKIAEDLAAVCGDRFAIVSGLARGIDAAAHRGALHRPCGTIAVLGTPVDRCYPYENRALYNEIKSKGLLLSETPPDMPLAPYMFPMRNRIIAGLSLGVVVVEAAERSGALITADYALAYNRDVFVVPGPITSPRSRGALLYFRQGAIPAIDENDIFETYKAVVPYPLAKPERSKEGEGSPKLRKKTELTVPPPPEPPASDVVQALPELRPEEGKVFALLLERPRTIDELEADSGLEIGLLHSVLLTLSIKRLVQQQSGSVYHIL